MSQVETRRRRRRMMRAAMAFTFCALMAHFPKQVDCESVHGGDAGDRERDHHLGLPSREASARRPDLCASCKGDNSTCRAVSGIFSRPQLNVGYNLVAHIPRGACNLSITEMRKSPNHLALQRRDGSFIFNGEWRLSQSGEYQDAGATFLYKRQDLKSPESITSSGPVYDPLDLMVLYQQPNPVIRYEYLISLPLAGLAPESYQRHGLGEAATSRPAAYLQYPTGAVPSPSSSLLHQPQQHPALLPSSVLNPYNAIAPFPGKPGAGGQELGQSQYSGDTYANPSYYLRREQNPRGGKTGLGDKKFYWKVTSYTNCSEPCAGGTQRSIVRCVRAPAGNPVADRRCSQEERPSVQTVRCNLKPCPAEWVLGDWSSCSEDCGEGFRSRTVHCRQKVSQVLTMQVAEGACLQQKPSSTTPCQLKPCNHWQTSEWSQCSAQCGSGIRKRTIVCVGSSGERLPNEECDLGGKPAEINPCNMGPCEGVDWFVSDWSLECTQTCGTGIQTRHVVCSSTKQENLKNFYNYSPGAGLGYHNHSRTSYVKKARRYPTSSSEIETNLIAEDPEELPDTEDYTDSDSTDHAMCDLSSKPVEERECFSDRNCGQPVWFTGDWGECSSSCGNGLQTRHVLCLHFTRGKFKVASDNICLQYTPKPSERQSCSGEKCPQRWFTTEWTECSALCGGGIQRRSVSCRASNWTLPSSLCYDLDRPVERRSCNEHKCTLVPTESLTHSTPPPTISSGGIFKDRPTPTSVVSSVESSKTRPIQVDLNEEADDRHCADQYRNCALVVQARLCRYKYYRSVCCRSCSDTL